MALVSCCCLVLQAAALGTGSVRPLRSVVGARRACSSCSEDASPDVNALLTALNAAVAAEDYAEASRLKALLSDAAPAVSATWPDDQLPQWLVQRLEQLEYRYPTPIQAAAVQTLASATDAVLRAPTGSGKSLAYLCAIMAKCDPALQLRGSRTVEAVSELDLPPTAAMGALAPGLSMGRRPTGSDALVAAIGGGDGGAGVSPRGRPLALVLVPRDALAEQVAQGAYALLGGYVRASRTWSPGASDSLFKYTGPKGGRVCVIGSSSDEAAIASALGDCDVLVCSASALVSAAASTGFGLREVMSALVVVAVDEADESLQAAVTERGSSGDGSDAAACLQAAPVGCIRLLAGATISDQLVESSETNGWLRAPVSVADGDGTVSEWTGSDATAEAGPSASADSASAPTATPMQLGIPPSVVHRACLADSVGTRMAKLARLMRIDLREWQRQADGAEGTARPRGVVFVADERAASAVGGALRDSLWGDHAVAILLPSQGTDPSLVTDRFRRAAGASEGFVGMATASGASVLVAPLACARGLDFANVS